MKIFKLLLLDDISLIFIVIFNRSHFESYELYLLLISTKIIFKNILNLMIDLISWINNTVIINYYFFFLGYGSSQSNGGSTGSNQSDSDLEESVSPRSPNLGPTPPTQTPTSPPAHSPLPLPKLGQYFFPSEPTTEHNTSMY